MPDSPEGPNWEPVPEGTHQENNAIEEQNSPSRAISRLRSRLQKAVPVDLEALLGTTELSGPKPKISDTGEILEDQPAISAPDLNKENT
jgi:hypothetical protein